MTFETDRDDNYSIRNEKTLIRTALMSKQVTSGTTNFKALYCSKNHLIKRQL